MDFGLTCLTVSIRTPLGHTVTELDSHTLLPRLWEYTLGEALA